MAAGPRTDYGRLRAAAIWPAALLTGLSAASAQTTALSFDEAAAQLERVSPATDAAKHAANAARLTEGSLSTLERPIVTVSAQFVAYQKTLSIDLSGPRQDALDRTSAYLDAIPGTVLPPFQQIAADIVGRISQALPGLFGAIPDELSYRLRDESFRPTVQALLPIYTGGAIPAIKRGAQAATALAEARVYAARDLTQVNLIRAYFGQITAAALEESARESRGALDDLLSDAVKLEQEGMIPHVRLLEAQVARDLTDRQYQRAVLAHDSARTDLGVLLELPEVQPTTRLFVLSAALPPPKHFLGREGDVPPSREAEAAKRVASAAVDLAKARLRPQAFAFGEYNLNRSSALPIEPDWIVGVGIRYTLFANIGRSQAVAAAREQEAAAEAAERGARQSATSATLRAWNLVESARRSFLSLDSNMAAAEENLRVQRISFREGEGTVTLVTAAEAALAAARAQRITAAYEYDLALAALLVAAGQLETFPEYMERADIRLAPAGAQ